MKRSSDAAAVRQIDAAGVPHRRARSRGEGGDTAPSAAAEDRAGAVDGQHAAAGAGVAERQGAVEGQLAVVAKLDRLPAVEPGDAVRLHVVEPETVGSEPAGNSRARADVGRRQVAQRRRVVVAAQVHRAIGDAPAVLGEAVAAEARQDVASDRAAGQGHGIGSPAEADVAADQPAGDDHGVVTEPGDQVAVDRAP